jgi:hypothetical protein
MTSRPEARLRGAGAAGAAGGHRGGAELGPGGRGPARPARPDRLRLLLTEPHGHALALLSSGWDPALFGGSRARCALCVLVDVSR